MTATPTLHLNGARRRIIQSREQFFSIDTRPLVEVECPEFRDAEGNPLTVLLRVMGSHERDLWNLRHIGDERYTTDPDKAAEIDRKVTFRERLEDIKPKYLALCIVGEDGERMFTPDDVARLADISTAAIDRLYERALELHNPLSAAQREEQAKNSSARPSDSPPSA